MAKVQQVTPSPVPEQEQRTGRGPIDWMGGWRTGWVAPLIILGITAVYEAYQFAFAWTTGIDAASREFFYTWKIPLVLGLIGITAFTLGWWGWLVRSGKKLSQHITHSEEVRRIAVFWGLVGAVSVTLFVEASFWPNYDGAWHQTAVRDTAFTPAHIPMFYLFFPMGITMTIGTYLYGRTRLPKVYGADKGFPWSFALLIAASVTEMMQVAMNEWGHSLWITEEIFAVPFHWPFVLYGWLAGGIFALWAETLVRLLAVEGEIEAEETAPAQSSAAASST
ncbi:MAG: methane monooxygenase/ammonia monooxygenase subunit C [Egibacteraceae bacterium]